MKPLLRCLLVCVLILSSCTSTKITSSWKLPNKTIHIEKLHKVLVVALLYNETNSRMAEDHMVAYLQGKGIASYMYFSNGFNKNDEAAIQQKIKEDGFDGAITMRLIDVDKDSYYKPKSTDANYPNYYSSFGSYFYRNRMINQTPDIYITTKTFTVETTVYSIQENKLIWTGITKSIDPKGMHKMTSEVAKAVYKKMCKEGFVTKE